MQNLCLLNVYFFKFKYKYHTIMYSPGSRNNIMSGIERTQIHDKRLQLMAAVHVRRLTLNVDVGLYIHPTLTFLTSTSS